jgi:hypothetical protein
MLASIKCPSAFLMGPMPWHDWASILHFGDPPAALLLLSLRELQGSRSGQCVGALPRACDRGIITHDGEHYTPWCIPPGLKGHQALGMLDSFHVCWNARAFAGSLQSCNLDRCRDTAAPAAWICRVGEVLYFFAATYAWQAGHTFGCMLPAEQEKVEPPRLVPVNSGLIRCLVPLGSLLH